MFPYCAMVYLMRNFLRIKIKKNRSGEGKIPGSGTVLFSSFKNLLKCF